jgi:flagellar biosynthesis chaperone FliJ
MRGRQYTGLPQQQLLEIRLDRASERLREANAELDKAEREYGEASRELEAYVKLHQPDVRHE